MHGIGNGRTGSGFRVNVLCGNTDTAGNTRNRAADNTPNGTAGRSCDRVPGNTRNGTADGTRNRAADNFHNGSDGRTAGNS